MGTVLTKKNDQVLLSINPSQPGHVSVQVHVKHQMKTVPEGVYQQCTCVWLFCGELRFTSWAACTETYSGIGTWHTRCILQCCNVTTSGPSGQSIFEEGGSVTCFADKVRFTKLFKYLKVQICVWWTL